MQGKKSSNPNYDGRGRGRTRNWTFIVYPDSAPELWRSILDDYHVSWIESELHDKDINPDGTPKKPHWHVLMLFDGVQSFEQVEEISSKVNSARPEKVKSVKGLIRYFGHLDNPEKYQYGLSGIICHQGADIGEILLPSFMDKLNLTNEILDFIDENNIKYFNQVLNYARKNKFDTWFAFLTTPASYTINNYLRGLAAQRKEEREFGVEDNAG